MRDEDKLISAISDQSVLDSELYELYKKCDTLTTSINYLAKYRPNNIFLFYKILKKTNSYEHINFGLVHKVCVNKRMMDVLIYKMPKIKKIKYLILSKFHTDTEVFFMMKNSNDICYSLTDDVHIIEPDPDSDSDPEPAPVAVAPPVDPPVAPPAVVAQAPAVAPGSDSEPDSEPESDFEDLDFAPILDLEHEPEPVPMQHHNKVKLEEQDRAIRRMNVYKKHINGVYDYRDINIFTGPIDSESDDDSKADKNISRTTACIEQHIVYTHKLFLLAILNRKHLVAEFIHKSITTDRLYYYCRTPTYIKYYINRIFRAALKTNFHLDFIRIIKDVTNFDGCLYQMVKSGNTWLITQNIHIIKERYNDAFDFKKCMEYLKSINDKKTMKILNRLNPKSLSNRVKVDYRLSYDKCILVCIKRKETGKAIKCINKAKHISPKIMKSILNKLYTYDKEILQALAKKMKYSSFFFKFVSKIKGELIPVMIKGTKYEKGSYRVSDYKLFKGTTITHKDAIMCRKYFPKNLEKLCKEIEFITPELLEEILSVFKSNYINKINQHHMKGCIDVFTKYNKEGVYTKFIIKLYRKLNDGYDYSLITHILSGGYISGKYLKHNTYFRTILRSIKRLGYGSSLHSVLSRMSIDELIDEIKHITYTDPAVIDQIISFCKNLPFMRDVATVMLENENIEEQDSYKVLDACVVKPTNCLLSFIKKHRLNDLFYNTNLKYDNNHKNYTMINRRTYVEFNGSNQNAIYTNMVDLKIENKGVCDFYTVYKIYPAGYYEGSKNKCYDYEYTNYDIEDGILNMDILKDNTSLRGYCMNESELCNDIKYHICNVKNIDDKRKKKLYLPLHKYEFHYGNNRNNDDEFVVDGDNNILEGVIENNEDFSECLIEALKRSCHFHKYLNVIIDKTTDFTDCLSTAVEYGVEEERVIDRILEKTTDFRNVLVHQRLLSNRNRYKIIDKALENLESINTLEYETLILCDVKYLSVYSKMVDSDKNKICLLERLIRFYHIEEIDLFKDMCDRKLFVTLLIINMYPLETISKYVTEQIENDSKIRTLALCLGKESIFNENVKYDLCTKTLSLSLNIGKKPKCVIKRCGREYVVEEYKIDYGNDAFKNVRGGIGAKLFALFSGCDDYKKYTKYYNGGKFGYEDIASYLEAKQINFQITNYGEVFSNGSMGQKDYEFLEFMVDNFDFKYQSAKNIHNLVQTVLCFFKTENIIDCLLNNGVAGDLILGLTFNRANKETCKGKYFTLFCRLFNQTRVSVETLNCIHARCKTDYLIEHVVKNFQKVKLK